MAINIEFKSQRGNQLDIKVRGIISDFQSPMSSANSAYDCRWSFNDRLKELPRTNEVYPEHCYKAVLDEKGTTLTIYHLNLYGDIDRTVAIITNVK